MFLKMNTESVCKQTEKGKLLGYLLFCTITQLTSPTAAFFTDSQTIKSDLSTSNQFSEEDDANSNETETKSNSAQTPKESDNRGETFNEKAKNKMDTNEQRDTTGELSGKE